MMYGKHFRKRTIKPLCFPGISKSISKSKSLRVSVYCSSQRNNEGIPSMVGNVRNSRLNLLDICRLLRIAVLRLEYNTVISSVSTIPIIWF